MKAFDRIETPSNQVETPSNHPPPSQIPIWEG